MRGRKSDAPLHAGMSVEIYLPNSFFLPIFFPEEEFSSFLNGRYKEMVSGNLYRPFKTINVFLHSM